MFRNQYDSDSTTWSPQGRLFQLEYAMEAVKQGSCSVGLRSRTHAVVVTLKRASSELGSHQKKVFCIDEHVGVAISGLCGDARGLCKFLRQECLAHRFQYDAPIPVERLVGLVADKSQVHTQRYGMRPYGVGLLVAGYDSAPHLFETCPSGNYFEFRGQAIGSRAQSAKTYIERVADQLDGAGLDELIRHGIKALRESVQTGAEGLSAANCSVGVVGPSLPFTILEDDAIRPYVGTETMETAD
jgi:20S proteasome subunit alpha 6